MKSVCFSLFLFWGLILVGCSEKAGNDDVVEPLKPLELNKHRVALDKTTTVDYIWVTMGNGGYTLIFPKKLSVDVTDVPYSESILKLSIDTLNRIVIERKLLNDQIVCGYFIVKDSRGLKRLFEVNDINTYGFPYTAWEAIEAMYLNDEDYWQQ
jgi:hypothetical protein